MAFPTRHLQAILDIGAKPAEASDPPEVGRVLRYAVVLAACWFVLSGGVVYVVIALFAYIHGEKAMSPGAMAASVAVLMLTLAVAMFLFVFRPRT